MSGHSRWAQIKRQKGAADVRRGAQYTKLGHAIALAVREGGKDPAVNVRLRLAMERARAANMPGATITRALQRGAGELAGETPPETMLYEGYGPGGAALLVEALTDNRNRTAGEVRRSFTAHGGTLAGSGSVRWMFAQRGVVRLDERSLTAEQELACIDAGAEDVEPGEDGVAIRCAPNAVEAVRRSAETAGLHVRVADIAPVATTSAPSLSEQDAARVAALVAALEENDDVLTVTTNAPHVGAAHPRH